MGAIYEVHLVPSSLLSSPYAKQIVIYTASLSKYADPLLDKLDIHNVCPSTPLFPDPRQVINHRLFRESCVYHGGHYVKDLSLLNRDVSQCILVDNSPMSYTFHPGLTT
jgi:carboxy-terminal domain RNA polymerase II polypeptide A small phosphatase